MSPASSLRARLVSRPSSCAASRCRSGLEGPGGGSRITLSRKLWLPALRLTRVGEDGGRGDDHAEAVRDDGVRLGVAARLVRAHVTRDGVGEAVTEVDLVSTS